MARKLQAGPIDGQYISRRTDNDYSFAVAVYDSVETVMDRSTPIWDPAKRVPNPTFGKWVSFSWHRSYDLAVKSRTKAANLGYRAVIVKVTS